VSRIRILGRRDTAQLQLQRADAILETEQAVRVNAKPRQLRVNETRDGRGHHFVARLRD
jgi:hypothetical protein